MASLSFLTPPPASQEEYKPFSITVRLTYQAPADGFSSGTFTVNLRYGGTTVWTGNQSVSGLSPAPFPQTRDVSFTVETQYSYTGAQVQASFSSSEGTIYAPTQTINITDDATSPTVVSSSASVT